jgi:hypothetical protein
MTEDELDIKNKLLNTINEKNKHIKDNVDINIDNINDYDINSYRTLCKEL